MKPCPQYEKLILIGNGCRGYKGGIRDGAKNYIFNMPRKARIDYPGLTHHIMARTFDGVKLFIDDDDRKYYVSCFEKRMTEFKYPNLSNN